VEATRTFGARSSYIMFRRSFQIACRRSCAVHAPVATAILIEAGMSFVGSDPASRPCWGSMAATAQLY